MLGKIDTDNSIFKAEGGQGKINGNDDYVVKNFFADNK